MNFLTRLIGVAVIGALAWNSHAEIQCAPSPDSRKVSIVLIEDPSSLSPVDSKQIYYVDWSEKMRNNWLGMGNSHASDAFIYTSTVMNFLEMASLVDWSNASFSSGQNLMATRLGLFFVQLGQSRVMFGIWNELVKSLVPVNQHKNFLGLYPASVILSNYPTHNQKKLYVEQLSELLVLTGQRLREETGYEPSIPFSSIIGVALNPRQEQDSWQTLLYRLVKWQFHLSEDQLKQLYCEAYSQDADQLVVKIPPTPLLDFYINEFDEWAREHDISLSLSL